MMIYFLTTLKLRNEPLFYFGLLCMLSAILFLLLTRFSQTQVNGVNAWYKPFKFALSIGMYCWTMGWFCFYLNRPQQVDIYNYVTIILLGFELFYIALQASRGQLSHFNLTTPVYKVLFNLMGLAATAVTLYTLYIGILFFNDVTPGLPDYYLWSIRLSIIIFVVFAMEGAVMGSRMAHTIGGADGSEGIPILNWSKKFGDGRIAHFVGMHALQVLPLLSFYFIKNVTATIIMAALYGLLAVLLLMQALNGNPLVK